MTLMIMPTGRPKTDIDLAAAPAAAVAYDRALPPGRLEAIAARRAQYRIALCQTYGQLTGGTVDQSNAAICEARDVDQQLGDLLALMRESGVIANGR